MVRQEAAMNEAVALRLWLRPDVHVAEQNGALIATAATRRISVPGPSSMARMLRRLSTERMSENALIDRADDKLEFFYLLERLRRAGLLCEGVITDQGEFATLVPMAAMSPRPGTLDGTLRLSRFACMRADEEGLLLESPLSASRIHLHDTRASMVLAQLARGTTLAALQDVMVFVELLQRGGFLAPDEVPRTWEFHDLLFHARSRRGRHDYPFGGLYPFVGDLPPLPAFKAPMSEDEIALDVPDMDMVRRDDRPLADVMETRRSMRQHGETPLSIHQLGVFLYRTVHVRETRRNDYCEVSMRTQPGGGAMHPLEIYLFVHRCEGLAAGMYHYRPLDHKLNRLPCAEEMSAGMLELARKAVALEAPPQILLVFAARFERMAWKYRSMAYALILKDVGVLIGTMYLVATAMGLAPCAVGSGDADLFARATGLDYCAETSVGEFILGSLA